MGAIGVLYRASVRVAVFSSGCSVQDKHTGRCREQEYNVRSCAGNPDGRL
jgi:hypothetical protein